MTRPATTPTIPVLGSAALAVSAARSTGWVPRSLPRAESHPASELATPSGVPRTGLHDARHTHVMFLPAFDFGRYGARPLQFK